MLASWRTFGTNTCRPRSARQRSTARTVGRATDPRRAFEAGGRGGSNDSRAVHGSGSSPAFAVLEYGPPKPRRGYCFNRFFVVPTATFRLLFGLVSLRHDRRYLVHLAVTSNPTAEWIARQISEAVPWHTAPRISSVIAMAPTSRCSGGGSGPWGSEIVPPHPVRPGKTPPLNG